MKKANAAAIWPVGKTLQCSAKSRSTVPPAPFCSWLPTAVLLLFLRNRSKTCAEYNPHVFIQGDNYFVGADGLLMPTKKDQPGPDLRYFKQSQK